MGILDQGGTADAFIRGLANSASFGSGKYAKSALDATMQPGNWRDNFNKSLAQEKADYESAANAHPLVYGAGAMAGGVPQAALGPLAAAGSGAVQGALDSNDLSSVPRNAAIGGALGGVAGALGNLFQRPVAQAANQVSHQMVPPVSSGARVIGDMAGTLKAPPMSSAEKSAWDRAYIDRNHNKAPLFDQSSEGYNSITDYLKKNPMADKMSPSSNWTNQMGGKADMAAVKDAESGPIPGYMKLSPDYNQGPIDTSVIQKLLTPTGKKGLPESTLSATNYAPTSDFRTSPVRPSDAPAIRSTSSEADNGWMNMFKSLSDHPSSSMNTRDPMTNSQAEMWDILKTPAKEPGITPEQELANRYREPGVMDGHVPPDGQVPNRAPQYPPDAMNGSVSDLPKLPTGKDAAGNITFPEGMYYGGGSGPLIRRPGEMGTQLTDQPGPQSLQDYFRSLRDR
jgi:hypothetical protein